LLIIAVDRLIGSTGSSFVQSGDGPDPRPDFF
jgi:hypothetical protein